MNGSWEGLGAGRKTCHVGMGCTSVVKGLILEGPGLSDPWTHKMEQGAAHLNPGTWVEEQGGSEVQGIFWLWSWRSSLESRRDSVCQCPPAVWKFSPRSARLQKMIVFPEHSLKKKSVSSVVPLD